MSKKNSKARRQKQLKYDKHREERIQKRLQKQQLKAEAKREGQLEPAPQIRKKKKIKLKKGKIIRGIKITDADSKQRVLEILKAEQALEEQKLKGMEVEADAPAATAVPADAPEQAEKQPKVKVKHGVQKVSSKKKLLKKKEKKEKKQKKKEKKGKKMPMQE